MLSIDIIFFTIILVFFFNYVLNKTNVLLDQPEVEIHKSRTSKTKVPISLGIVLSILSAYLLIQNNSYINLFVILIFFVGLLSDIRYLHSPGKRIILQSVIIFAYLLLSDNLIYDTRIMILNELLNNNFFTLLDYYYS